MLRGAPVRTSRCQISLTFPSPAPASGHTQQRHRKRPDRPKCSDSVSCSSWPCLLLKAAQIQMVGTEVKSSRGSSSRRR